MKATPIARKILSLIALLAVLQATEAIAQEASGASPPPREMDTTSLDLSGAGQLAYTANSPAFLALRSELSTRLAAHPDALWPRLKLAVRQSGAIESCTPFDAGDQLMERLCKAIRREVRFNLNEGYGLAFDRGSLVITAGVTPQFQMPGMIGGNEGASAVIALVPGIDTRGPVAFPDSLPASAIQLGNDQGSINVALEYPALAMRQNIGSDIVAWVGFDAQGRARSCHPISSSDSAYMVNETCGQLVRTGRYAFSSDAAKPQELGYYRAVVHWRLR